MCKSRTTGAGLRMFEVDLFTTEICSIAFCIARCWKPIVSEVDLVVSELIGSIATQAASDTKNKTGDLGQESDTFTEF